MQRILAFLFMLVVISILHGCSAGQKIVGGGGPGFPSEGISYMKMGGPGWTTTGLSPGNNCFFTSYDTFDAERIERDAIQLPKTSNIEVGRQLTPTEALDVQNPLMRECGVGFNFVGLRRIDNKYNKYYEVDPTCSVKISDKCDYNAKKPHVWYQVEKSSVNACPCKYFILAFGEYRTIFKK